MDIPNSILLLLILLILLLMVTVYIVFQQQRVARALEELKENSPMVITDAMFQKLHSATFAILDDGGHPVGCGFFVTSSGIALTAAHACDHARAGSSGKTFRASTYNGHEFSLLLVTAKVGALDVAVLRLSVSGAPPPRDYLLLPSVRYSHQQLLGAPVALIHGSIAWSARTNVRKIARDNGTIIASNDSELQYSVSAYKGHSDSALLFRNGQVIGLHSEGLDDLKRLLSESSRSTSANAVRLDVPLIWDAVRAAEILPAPKAGGGARRRKQSRA